MFENSLIESEHHGGGSKKALSFPVSVLIHGVVIGAALGASIWFVGDVPEPPIPVTFYAAAPPPPLVWSTRRTYCCVSAYGGIPRCASTAASPAL